MSEAPAGTAPKRAKRQHVHEIDVVRVLTFASVIGVHTVANVNPSAQVWPNAALMLLHFTRSAFFALTGFVLTYQYLDRRVQVGSFWRRRLTLVGVPYLTWSVLYTLLGQADHRSTSVGRFLLTLGENIGLGTAWYHLYFLLVSMQIYLLFPVLQWLLRRTAGHHGTLLAVSLLLQLATLYGLRYAHPSPGWAADLVTHSDTIVVTYQFYVLAGAVAAGRLEQLRAWVPAHRTTVVLLVAGVALVTEAFFTVEVLGGMRANQAATVLQPAMVPWSITATFGLFAIGVLWSRRHAPESTQARTLRTASDRSFGVFLVHPAVLWLVLWLGDGALARSVPGPLATVIAYLTVVVGSVLFTELARHTPVSMPLTGRPPLRRAASPSGPGRPSEPTPIRTVTRPGVPS